MRRKNNSFREGWTAVIMGLAAALGTGCIILGLSLLPVGEAAGGQAVPRMAELVVNQGLGMGLDGSLIHISAPTLSDIHISDPTRQSRIE